MQIQRKMQRAWQRKAAMAALTVVTAASCGTGYAMPQNGDVKAGSAEIKTSDNTMNINQTSQKVAIDWKGFDIAKLETVNFNQPNAAAIALNRVTGSKGSEIYGHLNANGQVFLINPNGVLFGKDAEVSVGGLIATTHNISNDDFMNSKGSYTFTGDSANQVKNEGTIKAEGGLVALLAADAANEGTIQTNKGTTALGAGQSMTIDYENDGKINFAVNKSIANAKALNSGSIQANGGYVVMTARDASATLNTVVNNTGTIEAKSLKNVNGQIVLDGGGQGVVEVGGTIDASGDEAGETGGNIKVTGNRTWVLTDAVLKATGDQAGGLIETSGDVLQVDSQSIDASSTNGTAGEWLLDPMKVVIDTKDNVTKATTPDSSSTSGNTTAYIYEQKNGGSGNAASSTYDQYNKTSYITAEQITDMLDKGTNVTITSLDKNKVSSIEVDAPLETTYQGTDKAVALQLNAQRDIVVNKKISATGKGKLDISLHSDTDGDAMGAVVINANINTNGGSFTSGSGADLIDTKTKEVITPGIQRGTVGTYFGTGASVLNTNGGDINLYGDVAIGTGEELTMNTRSSEDASDKGAVTITGNVDSGNSYKVVKFDKANGMTWEQAYKTAMENTSGGSAVNDKYLATITTALENSVANAQNAGKSEELFVGGLIVSSKDQQGNTVRKAYWVTGPEGQKGTDKVVVGKNNYNGTAFYEAYADSSKGTSGTLNDLYAKWGSGEPNNMGNKDYANTNKQPYVAVGYGPESKWDDVRNGGGVVGYIQETNKQNSALNIQAGGAVTIGGDIGNSKALSNLKINNQGNVTIGGMTGTGQTKAYEGNIHVQNAVGKTGAVEIDSTGIVHVKGSITAAQNVWIGKEKIAASVEVDGKITSGSYPLYQKYGDLSTVIYAHRDISTNGIVAKGKVIMISTDGTYTDDDGKNAPAGSGRITLNGKIKTASGAEDAVIISTKGSFRNNTDQTDSAIEITGKRYGYENGKIVTKTGNWTIYSATPYADTFGTNLNSNTNAVWASTNLTGQTPGEGNHYVFAYSPTATVTAVNGDKTYGDGKADVTYANGKTNVDYTVEDFTNHGAGTAFVQDKVKDVFTKQAATTESAGYAATATRNNGDLDANNDGKADKKEKYAITLNQNDTAVVTGYQLAKDDGVLTINKRDIAVKSDIEQTYGNAAITNSANTVAATGNSSGRDALVNGDQLGTVTSHFGKDYTDNQKGRTTADAGTYTNVIDEAGITGADGSDASVNYDVKTAGTATVNKADLTVTTAGINTTYGTVNTNYQTTHTALVNGDTDNLSYSHNDNGAYRDAGHTGDAGTYNITTTASGDALKNYNVTYNNGTINIDKANLTVTTADVNTTYGTVDKNYQTTHTNLVNGDADTITYTYNDHGAYVSDTRTGSVGDYALDTTAQGNVLRNYNVTTNTANINLDAATVNLNPSGEGSTTGTATITEGTPSYVSQLVNGDTTATAPTVTYAVGSNTSGNDYAIIVDVNGNPIVSGDVVGNYRFNYAGVATITPAAAPTTPSTTPADNTETPSTTASLLERVKLDYRDTSNLAGSGLYSLAQGADNVPGVNKILGLTDAQLPFFKVAGGQVSNYGTYDVTETPTEVKVTPTAKHIPEPNKEKNQYRALSKTYELTNGTGAFNLVYDGTTFNIYPADANAKSLLKAGDAQHNVEVGAKALYSSFNEMGIVLEDLDAIYIHTDATEDEAKA